MVKFRRRSIPVYRVIMLAHVESPVLLHPRGTALLHLRALGRLLYVLPARVVVAAAAEIMVQQIRFGANVGTVAVPLMLRGQEFLREKNLRIIVRILRADAKVHPVGS